jgi:hypothetical protein
VHRALGAIGFAAKVDLEAIDDKKPWEHFESSVCKRNFAKTFHKGFGDNWDRHYICWGSIGISGDGKRVYKGGADGFQERCRGE